MGVILSKFPLPVKVEDEHSGSNTIMLNMS